MKFELTKIFSILSLLFLCTNLLAQEKLYLAEDYVFVGEYTQGLEGPVVDKDGNLYFVNPKWSGSIGKIDSNGKFSLLIDSLPNGSVANGIRISSDGDLFLADYTNHNILRLELPSAEISIYAHDSNINQPNDLTICCGDRLYASDPNWSSGTGNLLLIENGKFFKLMDNMGTTNGIEVSPDERVLYVNESVQGRVWKFDILPNGNLENKQLLVSFDDFGLDGMRSDIKGNLYITRYGKGTIVKISPEGKILREISLKGKLVSNLAFGGDDGRTVFVTTQDRGYIEKFRVDHAGSSFVGN